MYKVLKTEGRAKRASLETVHGTIQTPVFMNVGTVAAIKGAVSTDDLRQIKTQAISVLHRASHLVVLSTEFCTYSLSARLLGHSSNAMAMVDPRFD